MLSTLLDAVERVVGPQGLLLEEAVRERPATIRGGTCAAAAIVRPADTAELSSVMAICHAAGQPVVPIGGGTGLVGGTLAADHELMVSLERMNRIEAIDPLTRTAVVQAGVPVQAVQQAAEAADLLFAVDFGARGSATIGGAIATNAGGNRVLRFGMMREQVLGLEAVLADGTVVSSLCHFLKNNAGYDIKQHFIGSEGTLGIVTRAVLRLRPLPRSRHTALLAAPDYAGVMRLLALLDGELGGTLSGFEVMWNDFYRTVVDGSEHHRPPLPSRHPYYVLTECLSSDPAPSNAAFEAALEQAIAEGVVRDAVLARSKAQQDALWAIRDDIPTLTEALSPLLSFDVSLNLPDIEGYVAEVRQRLAEAWPNSRCVVFGHLGDGNIHLVVSVGSDDAAIREQVEDCVYGALRPRGGSISAEHGIGLDKRGHLGHSRSASELALMRSVKAAFDPTGILNPGKVLA